MKDKINSYQFMALAFVCTLSPMVHTLPDSVAQFSGDRAWLSCCIAILPGILLCFLMGAFLRRGSLCDTIINSFGSGPGRGLCLMFFVWLVFLAGFILRAEGQRFVSTAYPLADPRIFAAVSLLLCVPAVLGGTGSIARVAMLLRPVLALVLAAVFISALPEVDLRGLWQPGRDEIGKICIGALPAAEPMCFALYILFLGHRVEDKPRPLQYFGLILAVWAVALLMVITVLGTFGTELCLKIYAPFFSMVRDLDLFGDVDRIEAVVTAVWVFSDFVIVSVLLSAANECLTCVIPAARCHKLAAVPGFAGALAVGLFLAPTSRALEDFIEKAVPLGNLCALGVLVLVLAASAIRGKTKSG